MSLSLRNLMETVRSLTDCARIRNVTKQVMMVALDVVAVNMLDIVNKSLTRGEFPDAWKKTLVDGVHWPNWCAAQRTVWLPEASFV